MSETKESLSELQQILITDEEMVLNFNAHIKNVLQNIKEDSVTPTILVISGDETEGCLVHDLIVFGGMPSTHEQRREVFKSIGIELALKKINPLMAIFVSETWTCKYSTSEERDAAYQQYGDSLSNHPKATEALGVSARTLDGRQCFKIIPYERDYEDKIVLPEVEDIKLSDIRNPITSGQEAPFKDYLLDAFFRSASFATLLNMFVEDKIALSNEEFENILKEMPASFIETVRNSIIKKEQ